MKKITPLLFASIACGMLCSSVTYAQDKLWGINQATLFHMNTDGSEYIEPFSNELDVIVIPTTITLGLDGFIYGSGIKYNASNESLFKIDLDGIKILHTFTNYAEGANARVVDGEDGFIYGVAVGSNIRTHQVFKVRYDGSDFMAKQDIARSFIPEGLTRTSGGAIVGLSRGGGTFNKGFVYRIRADFTGIDVLYSFSGENGIAPHGKLVEGPDGNLYGTTMRGGNFNFGVIYKVSLTGEYTKLFDFNTDSGRWPQGGLTLDEDGFLYGTTTKRARSTKGLIFRVKPDGSDYTRLHEFDELTGLNPSGDIFLGNDGFLYGQGFRIKKDGTGLEKFNQTHIYFLRTDQIVPNVYVTYPSSGSVDIPTASTFHVNEIIGAANYTLELSETPEFSGEIISITSATDSLEVSNLKNSTLYYARVKSSMWPEYGPITSFTTEQYAYAYPPKLWGIQDNAVVYMNLDGSEYEQSFQVDINDLYPFWLGEFPKSISFINNEIYGINRFSNQHDEGGSLYKIKGNGIHSILEASELNIAHITDGGNGYIYGVNQCDEQCSIPYIFKFNLDGSNYASYNVNIYGFNPIGDIITTHDQKMIGLSSGGGANNNGFMYSIRADLSGIDILYSFSGPDGKAATTKLLEGHDGKLYGVTTTGGLYNYGVVFSIQSDGQGYTKLHDFTKTRKNGTSPTGNLVQDVNHTLYGICQLSGSYKKGMIFRIDPDGSNYSIVYNFDGTIAENPHGNLLIEEDYLYGTADGKFFRVKTNGTNFTILHNGNNLGNTLSFVTKNAIQQDTHIISEIGNPGYSFFSVPISLKPFSTQYKLEISKYPDFNEIVFSDSNSHPFYSIPFVEIPVNNLEHSTTYYARARSSHFPYFGPVSTFTTLPQTKRLFGLARAGGLTGCDGGSLGGGAIYSIELDGSNFIKHLDYPCGALLEHGLIRGEDLAMYGTINYATSSGGQIFRIDLSGNLSYVGNLNLSTGDFMQASTGNFYLTEPDHPFDHPDPEYSTLHFVEPNPPAVAESSVLFTFNDTQGNYVNGAPTEREDGYLYGLSATGGLNQDGTLYKISLDGEEFEVLYHFTQSTGANPYGSLVEDEDHALYGTTSSGGLSNRGTIFSIQPDGTDYQVIYDLLPESGIAPGKILLIGDTLYAATSKIIFKLHKNGTGYTTIHYFEDDNILGVLRNIISDGEGYLYGVRPGAGGTSDLGYIFKIRTNGAEYSVLHTFTNYSGGWGLRDLLLVDPALSIQSQKPAQKSIARQGETDFPVIKKESLITLSPNPFENSFAIQVLNKDVPSNVIISDVNGRVLYEGELSITKNNELGDGLSAGLYIVRVIQGNKTSVYRVIKK